jgi:hypothetical protein
MLIFYLDSLTSHTIIPIFGVPLFSWLLVATAVWPALGIASLAVNVFVVVIESSLKSFENIHYMLMGLSRALR